jgi:hypothetical protein
MKVVAYDHCISRQASLPEPGSILSLRPNPAKPEMKIEDRRFVVFYLFYFASIIKEQKSDYGYINPART